MAAIVWATCTTPAHARLQLVLPVDCTIGKDCFIQNYVDHDDAPDVFHDYTCGTLGYDGHRGTDFRVAYTERLEGEGVDILAAANGTVAAESRAVTINKDDFPMLQIIKLGMIRTGSDCGAGLRIDHGNGWHSHYCHMREGSLTVKTGDRVRAGQVLGKMGQSGNTSFPHLHFELKHYDIPIDPFVGHSTPYDCEPERRYSLWAPEAEAQLAYRPAGVLAAGFSAGKPQVADVRRYGAQPLTALDEGQALGFWADAYGLRKGDAIRMELAVPYGGQPVREAWVQERDAAVALLSLTAEAAQEGWRKGIYRATLRITRDGEMLLRHQWETVLE